MYQVVHMEAPIILKKSISFIPKKNGASRDGGGQNSGHIR